MRKFVVVAAALSFPSVVYAAPKIETSWDNRCGDNSSTLAVRARNDESYAVDMRLCIRSKNERWTCWVNSNVQPGQWMAYSWNYYVCGSNGQYFWATRRAGNNVQFDDPPGYQRGY